METCTRNHIVGIKALQLTQPSLSSSPLSTGLASMRKLAVCGQTVKFAKLNCPTTCVLIMRQLGIEMSTLTIMNDTHCILTYSGHRGSTPLFIMKWVKVLHQCVIHVNQINPSCSSYSCPCLVHTCCM